MFLSHVKRTHPEVKFCDQKPLGFSCMIWIAPTSRIPGFGESPVAQGIGSSCSAHICKSHAEADSCLPHPASLSSCASETPPPLGEVAPNLPVQYAKVLAICFHSAGKPRPASGPAESCQGSLVHRAPDHPTKAFSRSFHSGSTARPEPKT